MFRDVDVATGPRVDILGVGISVLNMDAAIRAVREAVHRPGFAGYVTVTGVHGVMESQDDPELMDIYNRSYLSTPDGMPMVWLGRLKGHGEMSRVYGPDLMLAVMRAGVEEGWRHLLHGGGEGVASLARRRIEERIPGVRITGARTPPFRPLTDAEEESLVEEIVCQRPHCLWVGLGAPKQERFMAHLLRRHRERFRFESQGFLMLGVGAAFDFHAGRLRQAPRFVQRAGCEWLFRLAMEPRRLWKRYLKHNPRFVWRVASEPFRRARRGPV